MILPKTDYFGGYIATAILDMDEVDPMIARAIGNWSRDTLGEVYSTKLTFEAISVLAGGDIRRGHYRNPRLTSKGNTEDKELAKKFLPWDEAAEENIP